MEVQSRDSKEDGVREEVYQEALEYARKKHEGQFRIGGAPYIEHPIAVAQILKNDGYETDYQIAAVFHDLLEDTDALESEILRIGGTDVFRAVKLLTKKKGYQMDQYVSGIKSDPIAYAVKGADRLHNLQSAYCASEKFRKKYIRETLDWYMEFRSEIPVEVRKLTEGLSDVEEKEYFLSEFNRWMKNK